MSSNIEIEEKLKDQKQFLGCFPVDKIPNLRKNESIIINSDEHNTEISSTVFQKNSEN